MFFDLDLQGFEIVYGTQQEDTSLEKRIQDQRDTIEDIRSGHENWVDFYDNDLGKDIHDVIDKNPWLDSAIQFINDADLIEDESNRRR